MVRIGRRPAEPGAEYAFGLRPVNPKQSLVTLQKNAANPKNLKVGRWSTRVQLRVPHVSRFSRHGLSGHGTPLSRPDRELLRRLQQREQCAPNLRLVAQCA